MDPNAAAALAEKGILGILLLVAMGVIVFLFLRLEKSIKDRLEDKNLYISALQAEHGKRLDDKDKATTALLAQNDRLHSSLERMSDLVETIGRKTPQ